MHPHDIAFENYMTPLILPIHLTLINVMQRIEVRSVVVWCVVLCGGCIYALLYRYLSGVLYCGGVVPCCAPIYGIVMLSGVAVLVCYSTVL